MATCRMKLKKLECLLDGLEGFERPKIGLEQYATSGHLAACLLHCAETSYGDLEGKVVADLGCGSGRLGLGAALLGAAHVVGFEIDPEAGDVFSANKDYLGLDNCDLVLADVTNISLPSPELFDTVVMNPPFGTRASSRGIDVKFVEAGLSLAPVVYSLHKTSTRDYLVEKFSPGARALAQLSFDLPATYKFHTKRSVDIQVDLIRFVR